MRIIFMGSPAFSVPVLEALVTDGHDIACVYCQPPRQAGRGKKDRPTPVQVCAEGLGLDVRHPTTLRTVEAQEEFAALKADIAVVVAYGLILPEAILAAPTRGCLNIHASLLPRWRGAAPIHRAIMAGDAETGVCIMQMDAGLDTGPVLARAATAIGATETTGGLHDRLATMGTQLICNVLRAPDQYEPIPQSTDGVTYAAKIDKSETRIDWSQPAEAVDAHIRGLSPFPGAWFEYAGTRIKVLGSEVAPGTGTDGQVIAAPLTVACSTGAVALTQLQRAGKSVQPVEVFLNGNPMPPGTQIEG
jgi:methionyl-tRNA formyltransferase